MSLDELRITVKSDETDLEVNVLPDTQIIVDISEDVQVEISDDAYLTVDVKAKDTKVVVETPPPIPFFLKQIPDVLVLAAGGIGTKGDEGPPGPPGPQGGLGPQGPQGETGAPGASLASYAYQWRTDTTATDPGHGYVKMNGPVLSATELYLSQYDQNGQAPLGVAFLNPGDDLYLYAANQFDTWNRYVTDTKTDNGEWFTIKITYAESGPLPLTVSQNKLMQVVTPMRGEPGPPGPVGPQGPAGAPSTVPGPPGAQGPKGDTGLTGAQGSTGPSGPTGATGPIGPIGPEGAVDVYEQPVQPTEPIDVGAIWVDTDAPPVLGPVGPQGPIGPTGATGPQGPIGNTGSQGPQGVKGDTGATGSQGPIGNTGPQGPIGNTGAQGPQGVKGDTGLTGSQGPQGATGSQGPAGTAGEKWFSGAGAPATATGAIADWYLDTANGDIYEKTGASAWTLRGNIKGPQGATGATGSQGPIGNTGAQGPQGATGSQGPQGATGSQGPAGTAGEKWFTGAGAPSGATGSVADWYLDSSNGDYYEKTGASAWTLRGNLKGPQGTTGATGSQGPTGSTGATGPAGPKGAVDIYQQDAQPTEPVADGALWVDTDAPPVLGPTGPQGPTGPTGATGPQGPPGIDVSLIADAKGDILAASAPDVLARLPVGANGTALIADSSQSMGLKWGQAGADLVYWGGYAAGSYKDGDIVVASDGIAYMAVRPTTAAPTPWSTSTIPGAPTYGTSFPSNPVNGQEHVLVDSTTNPTYQWRFRFNANSASAYKWEFIGGPPVTTYRLPAESVAATSGAWSDLAGASAPIATIPRAGDYLVSASCQMYQSTGGVSTLYMGIWNYTTSTILGLYAMHYSPALMTYVNLSLEDQLVPGVGAGGSLKLMYQTNVTGTIFGQFRIIKITPVRVS